MNKEMLVYGKRLTDSKSPFSASSPFRTLGVSEPLPRFFLRGQKDTVEVDGVSRKRRAEVKETQPTKI